VAEVSLVDAVELVRGGEVHRIDDIVDGFAGLEPPLGLFHLRVFDRTADGLSADLREAQFCKLSRTANVPCDIRRRNLAGAVRVDEVLRHVDEPCRRD